MYEPILQVGEGTGKISHIWYMAYLMEYEKMFAKFVLVNILTFWIILLILSSLWREVLPQEINIVPILCYSMKITNI